VACAAGYTRIPGPVISRYIISTCSVYLYNPRLRLFAIRYVAFAGGRFRARFVLFWFAFWYLVWFAGGFLFHGPPYISGVSPWILTTVVRSCLLLRDCVIYKPGSLTAVAYTTGTFPIHLPLGSLP